MSNRDERLALLSIAMFAFDGADTKYARGVFDTVAHVLRVEPEELANVLGIDLDPVAKPVTVKAAKAAKKADKAQATSTNEPEQERSDAYDPSMGEEYAPTVHYPGDGAKSACGRANTSSGTFTEDVQGVTCKRCIQTNTFQRALNAWIKDHPEAAETVA